jgi:5-formyltetrahydrofolate cyclo-ligase
MGLLIEVSASSGSPGNELEATAVPSPAGKAIGQVQAAKQAVRERVWEQLERSGAALPPGAYGRIPMFERADAAADLLARLPEWQAARVVKANPDWAQMPVRMRALAAGKIVYMAVPRLAGEYPFVMLDPARLSAPAEDAGDKERALELGQRVQVEEIQPVGLAVAGSVAVNKSGARVGKGGGFSDIEIALLTEAGVIGPHTTVVTTVHPLQVVAGPLPETRHDFRVDVIVTPDEVIRATDPRPSPGIIWDDLEQAKIAEIPVLARLSSRR